MIEMHHIINPYLTLLFIKWIIYFYFIFFLK